MKLSTLSVALATIALLGSHTAFAQVETKVVTVNGAVIRYEPGQVIVIRGKDNTEKRYTLSPTVTVPKDIQIGQQATVYLEPSAEGGSTLVRRVTTASVTPTGQTRSTVEETRTEPSGASSTTTTTTTSGKVEAYTVGKSITVLKSDGSRVTYIINPRSTVPANVVVGKTIAIVPVNPSERVVQTITIREGY